MDSLLGHRGRLQERYAQVGLDGFADHEKLEFLLTFAISRKDCKPIAKALLRKFHNLYGVLNADAQALCEVNGIGVRSAQLIRLIKDVAAEYLRAEMREQKVIHSTRDVVDYLYMADQDVRNEKFKVIFLNAKHAILAMETMGEGTIDEAPVYVRKVVEQALKHNAKNVILCHNHPSGDPTPSAADRHITNKVQEALDLVDIHVLDHFGVGSEKLLQFQ